MFPVATTSMLPADVVYFRSLRPPAVAARCLRLVLNSAVAYYYSLETQRYCSLR